MIILWDEVTNLCKFWKRQAKAPAKCEARLILPTHDNNGRRLRWSLRIVESQLVKAFGGFTRVEGFGAWYDEAGARSAMVGGSVQREPVAVYDIAADDTLVNNMRLRSIASKACTTLGQVCIYTKDFRGNVALVYSPRTPRINIEV